MKWSEIKAQIDLQMGVDPQRATLARRAVESVEAGLTHLASIGHGFEIIPSGTLADLTTRISTLETLSVAEATEHVRGKRLNGKQAAPDFEAKEPH